MAGFVGISTAQSLGTGAGTGGTALTVTKTGCTAGNLLVVAFSLWRSGNLDPGVVTASGWSAGSQVADSASAHVRVGFLFLPNCGSGSQSAALSWPSTADCSARILEYSGMGAATLDGATGSSGAASPHNTGNATSAATGGLAIGVIGDNGANITYTVSDGKNDRGGTNPSGSLPALDISDLLTTVSTTNSAAWTSASVPGDAAFAIGVLAPGSAGGSGMVSGVVAPGSTWKRRFWKGVTHTPLPATPVPVVVAGVAPLPVIQGRRWPVPTRSASDWTSGNKTTVVRGNSQTIQPAVIPGGNAPILTIARRRPPAKRPGSDWNGSGSTLLQVSATGAQWVQAPRFNSGGYVPELTAALRRPPATRGHSRLVVPPPVTAQVIPTTPVITTGIRRRNLSRPVGRVLPGAPQYNSGGLVPLRAQGIFRRPGPVLRSRLVRQPAAVAPGIAPRVYIAQRRPVPRRPFSRLLVPPPIAVVVATAPTVTAGIRRRNRSSWSFPQFITPPIGAQVTPTTPVITASVRRRNLSRPASRVLSGAPQYNSGGVVPVYPRSVARQKPPTKPASDWGQGFPLAVLRGGAQTVQPQFNSGALAPLRTRGVFRRPIPALRSRLVLQPVAVPLGIAPRISIAQRREPARRPLSRLVVPPPSGVQITPTTPIVLRAVQKRPLPSRPASDWTASGVTSVLRGGAQWAPAPVYNSGGIQPLFTRSTQKRRPTRASARIFSPTPTPPPIRPTLVRGVGRKPAQPKLSRWLPAPSYNSGGIVPARSQGVRRINRHRPGSRIKVQAAYNSGGLKPFFRSVPRQKPPTRGRSLIPATGPRDIGLTRDITLLLGSPFSAWNMRVAPGHWATGQPVSAWWMRLGKGHWDANPAEPRWGEKPPEV